MFRVDRSIAGSLMVTVRAAEDASALESAAAGSDGAFEALVRPMPQTMETTAGSSINPRSEASRQVWSSRATSGRSAKPIAARPIATDASATKAMPIRLARRIQLGMSLIRRHEGRGAHSADQPSEAPRTG